MKTYWPSPPDNCTIVRVHRPTKESFVEMFVKPQKPAVITGITDEWKAMKEWNFDFLGKDRAKNKSI